MRFATRKMTEVQRGMGVKRATEGCRRKAEGEGGKDGWGRKEKGVLVLLGRLLPQSRSLGRCRKILHSFKRDREDKGWKQLGVEKKGLYKER